jgi:hypothetical protein
MKVLLRVEVEVVVLFAFIKKLLLHAVLALLYVLPNFELLRSEVVGEINVSLEKVFRHHRDVIFLCKSNQAKQLANIP